MARPRISTCRSGESPIAHQATETLPGVAHERVPCAGPARVSGRFLDLLNAAERPECLQARLLVRQAGCLQALDLAIEMELQLFAQIGFASIAEQDRTQPALQDVKQRARYVLCSTRLTPADSRSHFATSASSCLRPALVSE